ncbi:MAG: hypothetical protein M3116_01175 [Actinomycetota bacterium]|nr:hypothetical protein [Actinomycetota bacterium]
MGPHEPLPPESELRKSLELGVPLHEVLAARRRARIRSALRPLEAALSIVLVAGTIVGSVFAVVASWGSDWFVVVIGVIVLAAALRRRNDSQAAGRDSERTRWYDDWGSGGAGGGDGGGGG